MCLIQSIIHLSIIIYVNNQLRNPLQIEQNLKFVLNFELTC